MKTLRRLGFGWQAVAENVEVRGVAIGQGQPVGLILGTANRDPESDEGPGT